MKNYLEVGRKAGLQGNRLNLYVNYMKTRWAKEEKLNCNVGYAQEWAERFLAGREFEASDSIGQSILSKAKAGE